ncbi:MAG: ATP-binding protein [bacterium]
MADKEFYTGVKGFEDVARITLPNTDDAQAIYDDLQAALDACFRDGKFRIIIDMTTLQFPTASLIALLVEATSRARRLGGDLKLFNVTKSAKNNFTTFSPSSYLSLEAEEKFALEDFYSNLDTEEDTPQTESKTPLPESPKNDLATKDKSVAVKASQPPLSKVPKQSVDIVEAPFIEKLENSLDEGAVPPEAADIDGKEEISENGIAATPSDLASDEETSVDVDSYQVQRQHLRVKSVAKNLYSICDFVTDYAHKVGFDTKEVGKTKIAVYEASLNVIEHAYHSNPDNWIDVWIEFDEGKLIIEIRDYGFGFEGFENKRYDVESAVDREQTGGFGLYIIRRSMDEIEYIPDPENGNLLKMVKYLKN